MPATLDKKEEQRIMHAVKTAVALVSDGMSPNDAITKVARDDKFGPGEIRLIGHAYNTGQQLSQWRSGSSNILDKMASFPLCDPDAVIAAVYQTKTASDFQISSEYNKPPNLPTDTTREKVASMPLPVSTLSPYTRDTHDDAVKAFGIVERIKKAADDARRTATTQQDVVRTCVAGLSVYFKQASYDRLPFYTVKTAAETYYGTVAARLLDTVYVNGNLKEKQSKEKAAADCLPINLSAEPFTTIKKAIDAATLCAEAKSEELFLTQKYAMAKDALKVFCKTGSVPLKKSEEKQPLNIFGGPIKTAFGFGTEVAAIAAGDVLAHKATHPSAEEDDPYGDIADIDAGVAQVRRQVAKSKRRAVKRAEEKTALFGPAFGAAIGSGIGRGINSVTPKPVNDMVDDSWMNLEDPEHENTLRKIRAHAAINQLMTDPDDPISGHDPDKVLSAYNEISQATPRLAENIAMLRPVLRKRLEGHQEPFEAKELLDIEHGLAKTKLPTPNTNIMGETPSKLLG